MMYILYTYFFESLIFLYQIINFMSYYPILRKIPGRILPGTTSRRLCSIILRLLKQRPAAVERRLRNTGTGIQFWWKPRELQEALQESMFFSYLLFVVLVGGWATPLKNIKVNWDHYSPYMGKKTCSKPPTSSVCCNVFQPVQLTIMQSRPLVLAGIQMIQTASESFGSWDTADTPICCGNSKPDNLDQPWESNLGDSS